MDEARLMAAARRMAVRTGAGQGNSSNEAQSLSVKAVMPTATGSSTALQPAENNVLLYGRPGPAQQLAASVAGMAPALPLTLQQLQDLISSADASQPCTILAARWWQGRSTVTSC